VELFNGRVMIHRKFHPPSVAAAAADGRLAARTRRCRRSCRDALCIPLPRDLKPSIADDANNVGGA
jgi:hypothetical protein